MSNLDKKRATLAEVQGKLKSVNDDYEMKVKKKEVHFPVSPLKTLF